MGRAMRCNPTEYEKNIINESEAFNCPWWCIGVLMLIIKDYFPPENKNNTSTYTFVTIWFYEYCLLCVSDEMVFPLLHGSTNIRHDG